MQNLAIQESRRTSSHKKILILCTNSDEAGAPRHVEVISKYLSIYFSIQVVFGGNPGPVYTRLRRHNITTAVLDELKKEATVREDIKCMQKFIKITKKFKPKIINCHSTKAGLIGRIAGAITFTPVVFTLHGWGWRGLRIHKKIIVYLIELFFSIPFFKEYYIFVDMQSYEIGIKLFPWIKKRATLIFNGVPCPSLEKNTKFSDNRIYNILMPARVDHSKNHCALATAFENAACDDWRLVFCGQDTDSQKFKHSINKICKNKISQVSFVGQTSNIQKYYEQASIVALISNFEALPLTLLEAISNSLPIIASDVGGISVTLQNSNGFLIRNNNINLIESALIRLYDPMLRYEMGAKGYDLFTRFFTEQIMLKKIHEFYSSTL